MFSHWFISYVTWRAADSTHTAACDIILSSCRESYEIGRIPSGVGAVKQARTLRLLANAYLEWDGVTYWQKALNAVGPSLPVESPTAVILLHELLSCRSC